MSLGRNPWNAIAERGFGWCETVLFVCVERLAQSGWEGSYLQILSPPCLVCFGSGRHRDTGRRGRSRRGVTGLCRDLNFSTWVAAEAMGREGLMGRVTPKCFNSLAVRKRMAVAVGHFLGEYQVIRRCSLSERLCLSPYRCCELPGPAIRVVVWDTWRSTAQVLDSPVK